MRARNMVKRFGSVSSADHLLRLALRPAFGALLM